MVFWELETAIKRSIGQQAIALKGLVLDLSFSSMLDHRVYSAFDWAAYKDLMQVLQYSNLQEFAILSFNSIPASLAHSKIPSLQKLELNGEVHLKDPSTFRSFFTLLSAFPNLTHLHLQGYEFFTETDEFAGPDDMAKLEEMDLFIQYPTLCVLLNFLRRSHVMNFSFGGDDCERQMRWTRSNREEDFEKDCWTLWWY
ncbi:hypothetical protein JCM5353_007259 [Sporobolomyces roseus]